MTHSTGTVHDRIAQTSNRHDKTRPNCTAKTVVEVGSAPIETNQLKRLIRPGTSQGLRTHPNTPVLLVLRVCDSNSGNSNESVKIPFFALRLNLTDRQISNSTKSDHLEKHSIKQQKRIIFDFKIGTRENAVRLVISVELGWPGRMCVRIHKNFTRFLHY